MNTIDYSKLSESTNKILQDAQNLARTHQYDVINCSLTLIALVQHSKDMVRFVLNNLNIDYSTFCKKLGQRLPLIPRFNETSPSYSETLIKTLSQAISTLNNNNLLFPEGLLLEMASCRNELTPLFNEFNISRQNLSQAISIFTAGNRILSQNNSNNNTLVNLEKYARNLRKLAEDGTLEPTIGRDKEIRRILQIISRKTKNNPLLVGEPGTGKTAVIEGLAVRLNRGDVPSELKDIKIYSLDIATIIAGASMQGEFESRLKSIISDLRNSPEVILFIDEIHLLLGAGNNGGAMDAANILKPELARNSLKVIGATTFDEYNKFLESDQAFARRFQRIVIEEPSEDDTISILRGIKSRFEAHHKIKILDDAIISSVKLSSRYITDRFLPDKAIDILDETASRMRIERASVPEELDSLSRLVRQKEIERQSLIQESTTQFRLDALSTEIFELKEKENNLNAKWMNERRQFDKLQEYQNQISLLKSIREQSESNGRYEDVVRIDREIGVVKSQLDSLTQDIQDVENPLLKLALDSDDIKETIETATGIPVQSLNIEGIQQLVCMAENLEKTVKGQNHAIHSLCNVIKRSRMGLGNPQSPVGSFLFLGTTGVGKTELAKALAEYLFGTKDSLIRIDMSEYQQEHNVARLFGAPPGYVGYEQGGQLTEAVRRKPYSVILLDEIEKAHPKICETLLQVLDDGRMTDGKGRVINFKNTIIIMTSNLGAEQIIANNDCQSAELKDFLVTKLKHKTSPEFTNRIDDIIVFNILTNDILRVIAKSAVNDAIQNLKNNGFDIVFQEDVPDLISAQVDLSLGARPIKRLVNKLIVDELINKILVGEITKDAPINISVSNQVLTFINE